MNTEKMTTKAALCPNCNKFHLIALISHFNKYKETRKDFAEMLIEGFSIIEVTTKEAKSRFGFCKEESEEQLSLF